MRASAFVIDNDPFFNSGSEQLAALSVRSRDAHAHIAQDRPR
jgi:hypothetical protein